MSDAPYREGRISAQDGRQLYYRDYGDVLWDPKIARTIGQDLPDLDLPDLWPYFRALRRLPLLAIRGALSSVLSAETFAAMAQEIPDMTQVTVPPGYRAERRPRALAGRTGGRRSHR